MVAMGEPDPCDEPHPRKVTYYNECLDEENFCLEIVLEGWEPIFQSQTSTLR